MTASIVTQKAMDEVSKDEREIAKTLNFGLVYGAGIDNLAKHLQQKGLMVNRSEMEEFKQRFFSRNTYYSKKFTCQTISEAF